MEKMCSGAVSSALWRRSRKARHLSLIHIYYHSPPDASWEYRATASQASVSDYGEWTEDSSCHSLSGLYDNTDFYNSRIYLLPTVWLYLLDRVYLTVERNIRTLHEKVFFKTCLLNYCLHYTISTVTWIPKALAIRSISRFFVFVLLKVIRNRPLPNGFWARWYFSWSVFDIKGILHTLIFKDCTWYGLRISIR